MTATNNPESWNDAGSAHGDPSSAAEKKAPDAAAEELRPALDRATTTLRTALDEACRTNFDRANTGELIRVEEVLAIANEAAKEVISVRRRLRGDSPEEPNTDQPAPAVPFSREIDDAEGRRWRVFAVHPWGRAGRSVVRDAYVEGWLSFDSGNETRRLAPIPERWHELPDRELLVLCRRADVSPRRKRASDSPSESRSQPQPESGEG